MRNYVKSIKLFCEMADIHIPWKKITRGLPKGKKYADDRIPTIEEIRKLVEYPDRRIKAIVYTMFSSGIRIGAWDYLKWGHVRPIIRDSQVVAAKLLVYERLTNHSTGISDSYYRATEDELLQDYLKAGQAVLTINGDSMLLQKQVEDLTE